MSDVELNNTVSSHKIVSATKWSTVTEVLGKLVAPISSMILARLLAPEIFGIVASISSVISFCEVFSDAGFQKYIIQRETDNIAELDKISTIAFWTNLLLSLLIWCIVAVFSDPIAKLVGCDGYGVAVVISCALLPIHALSSIPSARLKRDMDFRTLFYVRLVAIFTPLFITLPLAFLTRSYWSLIIGNIVNSLIISIITLLKVKWKPNIYFSLLKLKQMFGFCFWSMLEAILVWIINWGDIFIVTFFLSNQYLGIYKTSINMINSIVAVVSASLTPVMLSLLSRLQDNRTEFDKYFYKISYYSGLLLVPMGVGLFVYRDIICDILLGENWSEGALLMGIWGLVSSISILFNSYSGCVYIAKGRPKISVIVQIAQIVVIIPAVYISVQISFECLSYTRALIRIVGMVINCIILWKLFSLSSLYTINKLLPAIFASIIMAVFGLWFLSMDMGIFFNICSIIVCVVIYLLILCLFKENRKQFLNIIKYGLNKTILH